MPNGIMTAGRHAVRRPKGSRWPRNNAHLTRMKKRHVIVCRMEYACRRVLQRQDPEMFIYTVSDTNRRETAQCFEDLLHGPSESQRSVLRGLIEPPYTSQMVTTLYSPGGNGSESHGPPDDASQDASQHDPLPTPKQSYSRRTSRPRYTSPKVQGQEAGEAPLNCSGPNDIDIEPSDLKGAGDTQHTEILSTGAEDSPILGDDSSQAGTSGEESDDLRSNAGDDSLHFPPSDSDGWMRRCI